MREPGWQVFDRDARSHAGYLYTATRQLSSTLATRTSREAVLSMIRFADQNVLDVGCGDGFFTKQYWDDGQPQRLVAVDASPNAIDVARRSRDGRDIEFRVADSHALPFPDDSFDIVLLQSILHHDDDPRATLREAFRVASRVVIHEPNGNNPGLKVIERVSRYHREHHERSYGPSRMKHWIGQADGHVVAVRFAGFVAMFAPDWLAKVMKRIEPVIEGTPLVSSVACAVYVIVAERGAASATPR